MSAEKPQAITPWYRQFWPWVIFGLPAIVVVASFVTLGIALQNPDSVVKDNFQREGFTVNRDLAAQRLATALALSAELQLDTESTDISIKLAGDFSTPPKQLKLLFIHPNAEKFDFAVPLYAAGNGLYIGELQQAPNGRWNLQLGAAGEQQWLLKKKVRIDNNKLTATLGST